MSGPGSQQAVYEETLLERLRMKCRSLKARRAADDKSAMLWVCYHC